MIYIAIPSITPRLAACAVEAIARTTPEPHRVAVVTGRTHGEALDYAVANLPSEATHLFTMDDDAAPLKIGWLTWLRHRMTCTETECTSFGTNSAVGALYSASALRRVTRRFADSCNPGDAVRGALRSNKYLSRSWSSRWWLRNCEVYRDDEDDLVFAHLGGGTIGHTWRYQGKLYPRIPTWLWPIMVRRYLNRTLKPERGSRLWHEEEHRP